MKIFCQSILHYSLITLYVTYCQLQNPTDAIRKVAEFIEVDLDEELLEKIVIQTSFKRLKEGKCDGESAELDGIFVEGFSMYRKGTVCCLYAVHFTPYLMDFSSIIAKYEQQELDVSEELTSTTGCRGKGWNCRLSP